MKFFFPDSQDLVDPGFDFVAEEYSEFRVRQRDDRYAHEVLRPVPFDGILVSKAIVDGVGAAKAGKYSVAQRHRLRRSGVRAFFRAEANLRFMGDCGAYSYKDEDVPPYSVEEVVEFYDECGFDFGISVDHLILQYDGAEAYIPGMEPDKRNAEFRQQLTLEMAAAFLKLQKSHTSFTPIGVAQGWDPRSYASAVDALQRMGYNYIAVGSMVPLRTPDILTVLEAINSVRLPATQLHLLGVTRLGHLRDFERFGVASFDSTSPLLQAFKDNRDNYYTLDGAYCAIRVPQVEGNPKLRAAITAGKVDGRIARRLEQQVLSSIRSYGRGQAALSDVTAAIQAYDELTGANPDRTKQYEALLEAMPWRDCTCTICAELGVEVVIFRGSERNKRRGFHNLHVFGERLRRGRHASSKRGDKELMVTQ